MESVDYIAYLHKIENPLFKSNQWHGKKDTIIVREMTGPIIARTYQNLKLIVGFILVLRKIYQKHIFRLHLELKCYGCVYHLLLYYQTPELGLRD